MRKQALLRAVLLATPLLALPQLTGCFGGSSLGTAQALTAGAFLVETVNIGEGQVWPLNAAIVLGFNHPVDASTIGFGSILIRPISPGLAGRPVTGVFEVLPGSGGRSVRFRPACPTNEASDNGAFVPGGHDYEIILPSVGSGSASVLRDTGGHALANGLSRQFRSPIPPGEPLFLDTAPGPAQLVSVQFPTGLNLFTDPEPVIEVQFDQAVDGRAQNLGFNNLFVVYADAETGMPGEDLYCGTPVPAVTCTSKVPGIWRLLANCAEGGARLQFVITGILPPDRRLLVAVMPTFRDLAGETNIQPQLSEVHFTPTLASYYARGGVPDPTLDPARPTADEFHEEFDNQVLIDPQAGLQLPPAVVRDGRATAGFDFPGTAGPDADYVLGAGQVIELNTSGVNIITDSQNRSFVLDQGVLNCDDFTIQAGAILRGRGDNPLVIYAAGKMTLDGTIDVSGGPAHHPSNLNTPNFPEGGAPGECGGGDGGTASIVTGAETLRGQAGFGAFGVPGAGGGGGEGGFQQNDGVANNSFGARHMLAAGGGGGTLAITRNEALVWTRWVDEANPPDHDNAGPDHIEAEHDLFDDFKTFPNGRIFQGDPRIPFLGGETGMRGTSWMSDQADPTLPHGMHGMEDEKQDAVALDTNPFDPDTTGFWAVPPGSPPGTPPEPSNFSLGSPVDGPDPGYGGPEIWTIDQDPSNDFWGRRLNNDGTVTPGELLTPWAGTGGGAGGDSMIVRRSDLNGNLILDEDLSLFFPSVPFSNAGTMTRYRKGPPGGGGGGQLLLMAIGPIRFGPAARLLAQGGTGNTGETVSFSNLQVSGSGGGSGGHVVVHSSTEVDFSTLDLGTLADEAAVVVKLADRGSHPLPLRAIGGRRGWCAVQFSNVAGGGGGGNWDGNPDYMIGRGGAGGNGIIQVHVPDPLTDIRWPALAEPGILDYVTHGGGPIDVDRVEEALGMLAIPKPYSLIPFFSSGSQVQSKWIDTGLAALRNPPGGPWPDYAGATLHFEGTDLDGDVLTAGGFVDPVTPSLATGPTAPILLAAFEVSIPDAALVFGIGASEFHAQFLRNPELLAGFDFLPDSGDRVGFRIAGAAYDRATDILTIFTAPADGSMAFALDPLNPEWSIRRRYFGVFTSATKDRLPVTARVRVEFQGTGETAPGSHVPDPGSIVPGPTTWTADLSLLKGLRFFRYRVTFDIDAMDAGVRPNSERPSLEFLKIPFLW